MRVFSRILRGMANRNVSEQTVEVHQTNGFDWMVTFSASLSFPFTREIKKIPLQSLPTHSGSECNEADMRDDGMNALKDERTRLEQQQNVS